jgi:hypothetical protein
MTCYTKCGGKDCGYGEYNKSGCAH